MKISVTLGVLWLAIYNVGKDPHRYAVQVSDTTMRP